MMEGSQLRIAMLAYHTCPLATLGGKDTGGMNVYVRDLAQTLGKMNVHVDVYTRSQNEHIPHVLHDLGHGNRIVHIRAGPEIPVAKTHLPKFLQEFVDGILAFVGEKQLGYDLIHSHYWLSGLVGINLQEVWGLPLVHMFHTLGMMKERVAREREVDAQTRVEGERKILSTADLIVAPTRAELAQLQWLYQRDAQKIRVIPPGVDLSHFFPIDRDEALEYTGLDKKYRILLFVGRIEPLKGIDILIQAVKRLIDTDCLGEERLKLLIIGGGDDVDADESQNPELTRLTSLCNQLGLVGVVDFIGKKGQHSLPYYYSVAEAVVFPSYYESFGLVALEAMACGTPVIASQVGGLAFLVKDGETGFLFPDGDIEALTGYLVRLLKDSKLRKDMGSHAVLHAQNYGWDEIAMKMVNLYHFVIKQSQEKMSSNTPGH